MSVGTADLSVIAVVPSIELNCTSSDKLMSSLFFKVPFFRGEPCPRHGPHLQILVPVESGVVLAYLDGLKDFP